MPVHCLGVVCQTLPVLRYRAVAQHLVVRQGRHHALCLLTTETPHLDRSVSASKNATQTQRACRFRLNPFVASQCDKTLQRCRCQANVTAEPFSLATVHLGPVAAMFTCAARIASAAAAVAPANGLVTVAGKLPLVNEAGQDGDWGVFLMADTPVIQQLALSDSHLSPHLLLTPGQVGHIDQLCSGGCALPGLGMLNLRRQYPLMKCVSVFCDHILSLSGA